jgi:hypothetical protein
MCKEAKNMSYLFPTGACLNSQGSGRSRLAANLTILPQ